MAYAACKVSHGRQVGRWVFVRQSKNHSFYGVQLYRYDGQPSISDPAAILCGWAIAIGVPFLIISYKHLRSW